MVIPLAKLCSSQFHFKIGAHAQQTDSFKEPVRKGGRERQEGGRGAWPHSTEEDTEAQQNCSLSPVSSGRAGVKALN